MININKINIKEETLNKIKEDINKNYKKINKTGFLKYMNSIYFIDHEILDKLVHNFNNVNIIEAGLFFQFDSTNVFKKFCF